MHNVFLKPNTTTSRVEVTKIKAVLGFYIFFLDYNF